MRTIALTILIAFSFFYANPFASDPGALVNKADSLASEGNRNEAISLLEDIVTTDSLHADLPNDELAGIYIKLARLYYSSRKFSSTLVAVDSAIHFARQMDSVDNMLLADAFELQGKARRRNKDQAGAIEALNNSLVYHIAALGEKDLQIARVQNSLSIAYRENRQLDSADSHALSAIAIARGHGPQLDTLTAQFYNSLSRSRQADGDYEGASDALNEAIKLSVPLLGRDHPNLSVYYNNLGNIQNDLGQLDKALASYEEALRIRRVAFEPDDPKVAQALSNVALIHLHSGNYLEAEQGFIEANEILSKKMGPEHPYVGGMLMNLGSLYIDQRRYSDAEKVLLAGKEIFGGMSRGGQSQLASILTNLAIVYRHTDRFEESESFLMQALETKKANYGETSPQVATTLNSLGGLKFSEGKYDLAKEYFLQALEMERSIYGDSHPWVAARQLNLAELYSLNDDWADSDSLCEIATGILMDVYGRENRWVADAWERRSMAALRHGDYKAALDLAVAAFNVRLKLFTQNAQVLSEPDALAYSTFLQYAADLLLSSWSELNTHSLDTLAARVSLATKGKVRDEMFRRRRFSDQENDLEARSLAELLRNTRWRLASAYLSGPSDDNTAYRHQLDSMANRSEQLEADLAALSSSFKGHLEQASPQPDAIIDRLPDKTILIEYLRFRNLLTGDYHYLALLFKDDEIKVSHLGPAAPVDSLVSGLREHMQTVAVFAQPTTDDLISYKSLAGELYNRLLGSLALNWDKTDNLIIAPDGPISMVSFAGLVDQQGRYLAESVPVTYLTAARNILLPPSGSNETSGLLALGAPDFDAHPEGAGDTTNRMHAVRAVSLPVSPLSGSRQELVAIAETWRQMGNEPVQLLLDKEATEENFLSEASGSRVIHLATHGFYTSEENSVDVRSPIEFGYDNPVTDNPLLKSGLCFAGVNHAAERSAASPLEDGILTALEVSSLPLSGTEIVVLSACESGAGDVVGGEGILGLRSAFHMAGAETVVSSLWSVSDQATARLMEGLYGQTRLSVGERLHQGELAILGDLRADNLPDHPYYWAPFVVVNSR